MTTAAHSLVKGEDRSGKNAIARTICGSSMMAISMPPGASGPPSQSQYCSALYSIQSVIACAASGVRRKAGSAIPCRILVGLRKVNEVTIGHIQILTIEKRTLWLFFVMRNTVGDGFGTYLKQGCVRITQYDVIGSGTHVRWCKGERTISHQLLEDQKDERVHGA